MLTAVIVLSLSLSLTLAAAILAAGAGIASIIQNGLATGLDQKITLSLVVTAITGALVLLDVAQQHLGTVAPTTALLAILTLAISSVLAIKVRKLGLIWAAL